MSIGRALPVRESCVVPAAPRGRSARGRPATALRLQPRVVEEIPERLSAPSQREPVGELCSWVGGDAWNGSPGGDLLPPKNCPVMPAGSGQRRHHLCAFDTELLGLCQNCLLDPTRPLCLSPSWVLARWPQDHSVCGSTRGLGHVAANPIILGIE